MGVLGRRVARHSDRMQAKRNSRFGLLRVKDRLRYQVKYVDDDINNSGYLPVGTNPLPLPSFLLTFVVVRRLLFVSAEGV